MAAAAASTTRARQQQEEKDTEDTTTISSSFSLEERHHLDWTAKQGRILTANGRANEYYTAERGFAFSPTELPHYCLMHGDNDFSNVLRTPTLPRRNAVHISPICGAWSRTYFVGGWEHSSWQHETVYNVQTNSFFIDLRIPTSRGTFLSPKVTRLQDYTNRELRFYARQHVFAGLSVVSNNCTSTSTSTADSDTGIHRHCRGRLPVCVRHHVLDWNFVGVPRPRPNKWWIEACKSNNTNDNDNNDSANDENTNVWKEWAYATDDNGQYYYCEQWERLDRGGPQPQLALRREKRPLSSLSTTQGNDDDDSTAAIKMTQEDGIIVMVGNHFNYIRGRALVPDQGVVAGGNKGETKQETANTRQQPSSLVEFVDAALDEGDREMALAWLGRIDAGHGRIVANGGDKGGTWRIDCAIQPWKEGTELFTENEVVVEGRDMEDCCVIWDGERWNVFDTTLESVQQVVELVVNGKLPIE